MDVIEKFIVTPYTPDAVILQGLPPKPKREEKTQIAQLYSPKKQLPSISVKRDDNNLPYLTDELIDEGVNGLVAMGAILLKGAATKAVCKEALHSIFKACLQSNKSTMESIAAPQHRHHLKLRFEGDHRRGLQAILRAVFPIISTLLTPEAHLVELATIVSNPGAPRQILHRDGGAIFAEEAKLYSAFMYLTDVKKKGGGTEAVIGSQWGSVAPHASKKFWDVTDKNKSVAHSRVVVADAGDILIFDSTLHHGATAVKNDITRGVLYMSFLGPGKWNVPGHTYYIFNDLLMPPLGPMSISKVAETLALGSCTNLDIDCFQKATPGYCADDQRKESPRCNWSCGACPKSLEPDAQSGLRARRCQDRHKLCTMWSAAGHCANATFQSRYSNLTLMGRMCRASCKTCPEGSEARSEL